MRHRRPIDLAATLALPADRTLDARAVSARPPPGLAVGGDLVRPRRVSAAWKFGSASPCSRGALRGREQPLIAGAEAACICRYVSGGQPSDSDASPLPRSPALPPLSARGPGAAKTTPGAPAGTSGARATPVAALRACGAARMDRCCGSVGLVAAFLGLSLVDVAPPLAVFGVVIDICPCVIGLGPLA